MVMQAEIITLLTRADQRMNSKRPPSIVLLNLINYTRMNDTCLTQNQLN